MVRLKYILGLFVLIGSASFADTPKKENGASTLKELKRLAVERNFDIRSLQKGLEESVASKRRALSPLYPQIGVAGGIESQQDTSEKQNVGIGYLYGNVNLFRGFEDVYKIDIADLEVEKSELRFTRAKFNLELSVEEQFSHFVFTQKAISLREKALQLNETHKAFAKKRKASGLTSDSDSMEFELRESILQSDLAALEQQKEESKANLKRFLGDEAYPEPEGALSHAHLKLELAEILKRVKSSNETVLLTSKDLRIAEVQSKMWRAKWLPEIDLQTRAGYLTIDERPKDGGTAFRGLVLAKFDIFSGFDTTNQRHEGEAKKLKLEAQLNDSTLSILSQANVLFRRIKTSEARYHLEGKNEQRAKKYYDSVMSEYRRGIKNSADVKVAAEGLFDSTLRRENFKYDFILQKLALEKLVGEPIAVEESTD